MPIGILSQALQGAGQGLAEVGDQGLKAAIMAERDQNLARLQQERDTRQNQFTGGESALNRSHQTGERVAGQDFHKSMETDVRQPFQRETQQAGFTHAEGMQDRGFTQQKELQESGQKFTAGENAADRKIRERQLSISAAHVNAQVKNLQQAYEEGAIKLDTLKQVQSLHKDYLAEPDPDKRAVIEDKILTMSGKAEKFQPIMGKDAEGNSTYVGAFDQRRGEMKRSGSTASGVDWSRFMSAPQAPAARAPAAAPKAGGIISQVQSQPESTGQAPPPQNSAFSENALLAQREIGIPDETAGQTIKALQAPNLSTEQKSFLSQALQRRMRELGKF